MNNSEKKPKVELKEEYDWEEFLINGKVVCSYSRIYPADILMELDDYGVINFRR